MDQCRTCVVSVRSPTSTCCSTVVLLQSQRLVGDRAGARCQSVFHTAIRTYPSEVVQRKPIVIQRPPPPSFLSAALEFNLAIPSPPPPQRPRHQHQHQHHQPACPRRDAPPTAVRSPARVRHRPRRQLVGKTISIALPLRDGGLLCG